MSGPHWICKSCGQRWFSNTTHPLRSCQTCGRDTWESSNGLVQDGAFKALRDALLAVEWGPAEDTTWCPICGMAAKRSPKLKHAQADVFANISGCILDAALTKAGLPDQESRDAARKELGGS